MRPIGPRSSNRKRVSVPILTEEKAIELLRIVEAMYGMRGRYLTVVRKNPRLPEEEDNVDN